MYVWTEVVQAVCEPVVPLKAMAGTDSFAASVAAPTVPEIRVVVPRFAIYENVSVSWVTGAVKGMGQCTAHVEAGDS